MPETKRRQAKWGECLWCKARGLDVCYKSGKRKVLERHMVKCEADYVLEQKSQQTNKIDVVLAMMERQHELIAALTARVSVLEQRGQRSSDPSNAWNRMSAKQCWKKRKENAMRYIRATLAEYDGPQKYYTTIWEYWNFVFPSCTGIDGMLQAALWPVLQDSNSKLTGLRGVKSDDPYFLFKAVWGKSSVEGSDLQWFIDALREVGIPAACYDELHIRQEAAEFDRVLRKFQATTKRDAKGIVSQGILPLYRIWSNVYPCECDLLKVAMSLPPTAELTWEIAPLLDQSPSVSEAARDGNTSDQDHRSSSDTHGDFVSVRLV